MSDAGDSNDNGPDSVPLRGESLLAHAPLVGPQADAVMTEGARTGTRRCSSS